MSGHASASREVYGRRQCHDARAARYYKCVYPARFLYRTAQCAPVLFRFTFVVCEETPACVVTGLSSCARTHSPRSHATGGRALKDEEPVSLTADQNDAMSVGGCVYIGSCCDADAAQTPLDRRCDGLQRLAVRRQYLSAFSVALAHKESAGCGLALQ